MIKVLLVSCLVVVFTVVGGVAGHILKSGSVDSSSTTTHAAESPAKSDAPDAKLAGKEKKDKTDSHGKSAESTSSSATFYYKFSREFVVPVLRDERVESLVILQINLEADSRLSQDMFSMEPKLRDNIMSTLIELSNDGNTLQALTDVENYETIRAMIMKNLQNVISNGIHNVLILDIAKQDF